MPKNALVDVHDHLVASLEELSDENVNSEELEKIVTRARAKCEVASKIGLFARLALDAEKLERTADYANNTTKPLPPMLTYRKVQPE